VNTCKNCRFRSEVQKTTLLPDAWPCGVKAFTFTLSRCHVSPPTHHGFPEVALTDRCPSFEPIQKGAPDFPISWN